MKIRTQLLDDSQEESYERFLHSTDVGLLYYSIKYRKLLETVLSNVKAFYLVAYEDQEIVGALPSFLKYNERYGNVLNALPFYGSNGGIIAADNYPLRDQIYLSLMNAFIELSNRESARASTIVTNPLRNDQEFYEKLMPHTLRDERIGQITELPTYDGDADKLAETLMGKFHQKTRNLVRKAMKSGFLLFHSGSHNYVHRLAELHRQNIERLGGLAKRSSFFTAVSDTFAYDEDYRIYVAMKDGQVTAALLVFFYNRTAEYFTPAVMEECRSLQPGSLLIFEAMQEASKRGMLYWNWGGTWTTQENVYHFKSRFGALDKPYYYYVQEQDHSFRQLDRQTILTEYPNFYVIPFNMLQ